MRKYKNLQEAVDDTGLEWETILALQFLNEDNDDDDFLSADEIFRAVEEDEDEIGE